MEIGLWPPLLLECTGTKILNLNLRSAFNIICLWTNDAFIFQVFNEDWGLVGDNL